MLEVAQGPAPERHPNEITGVENYTYPIVRFNVTQVSNGFLVETKDKHWNGVESVHTNIDAIVEALKEAFPNN
jgi:hypothetical protein